MEEVLMAQAVANPLGKQQNEFVTVQGCDRPVMLLEQVQTRLNSILSFLEARAKNKGQTRYLYDIWWRPYIPFALTSNFNLNFLKYMRHARMKMSQATAVFHLLSRV
jgi:hypothetical protein